MRSVNIHEAKTHLSRLVDAAAKGEPFIIAKAGKPMVKVVPIDDPGIEAKANLAASALCSTGCSKYPTISSR